MLHAQIKFNIKSLILSRLFNKESILIQKKIDAILDDLSSTQTGSYYIYKGKEYSRDNVHPSFAFLALTSVHYESAEEIHSMTLAKTDTKTAIDNYIVTALNTCINIAGCKLIFPDFVQDILKNIPASYLMNTEEAIQKAHKFRAAHLHEEHMMREQYTRSLLL